MVPELTDAIQRAADPGIVERLKVYLQVRPGGYGDGDRLAGVRVPVLRGLSKAWWHEPFDPERWVPHLRHEVHEHRMASLMVMGARVERGDAVERTAVYECYLANTDRVNNWDLVDESAARILGRHLAAVRAEPDPDDPDVETILDRLAVSPSVWERRMAVVATHHFLRSGCSADTYRIATRLLDDEHDLIHKATGWMLREAGKRVDADELRAWLGRHADRMPRTMMRCAIELFGPDEQRRWRARTVG